jgi:hypothetical protein
MNFSEPDAQAPVHLPQRLTAAAEIWIALHQTRAWQISGFGPAIPVAITDHDINPRAQAMGFAGAALMQLFLRVSYFENEYLSIMRDRIARQSRQKRTAR